MNDTIYYEARDFIGSVLPFSLHHDHMNPTRSHYVHKHKEIELIAGLTGDGSVITDMKQIPFTEGQIVVVPPNSVHYIVSDTEVQYYCLIIDTDYLIRNGIDPHELYFADPILDKELMSLFISLYEQSHINDDYRKAILKSYVLQILVTLCRRHAVKAMSGMKESRTLSKIKQSLSYIKKNFQRELTLDEIAAEAGLSKYHYCREFKKVTDMTPIEFINRTRCEHARELLETKKYAIAQVAQLCGFSTPSHFSKTFRSVFGSYPSVLLRQLRYDADRKVTNNEDLP